MGRLISVVFSEEMKRIARSKWVGDKPKIQKRRISQHHINYFEEFVAPPIPIDAMSEPRKEETGDFEADVFRKKPHLRKLLCIEQVRLVESGDGRIALELEHNSSSEVVAQSVSFIRGETSLSYTIASVKPVHNTNRVLLELEPVLFDHPKVQERLLEGDFRCDLFLDNQVRSFTKAQLSA